MTIHQLPGPCWVLNPALPGDNGEAHYDDRPSAAQALRQARENGVAGKAAKVRQLEGRCWVIQCDGDCEQCIDEEDECYVSHCETRAAAEETMAVWRWSYLGDSDLVFCEADRPEGAEIPPPSPAEQEEAGQLPLPGVAATPEGARP